jgi:hypothetical protein
VTLRETSGLREVSVTVGDALRRQGISAVLTGGACASIYGAGRYSSIDADFVLGTTVKRDALDAVMASLGFRRDGDCYIHPRVRFFVEFPKGPLGIGDDHRISPVVLAFGKRRTLALSPTDSCRDRLAAFYHWKDRQSLAMAVEIALHRRVMWVVIEAWSEREGFSLEFEAFRRRVTLARSARRSRTARRGHKTRSRS